MGGGWRRKACNAACAHACATLVHCTAVSWCTHGLARGCAPGTLERHFEEGGREGGAKRAMHCMHTRVQPSCVVQACSWCTHRLAHCCTFDTRFVHNISHMDVLLVQAQQCATHASACICTHLLCIRCTLTTTSLVQTFARAPFCTLRLHLHALHVHTGAWLCSLCVHTLARSPVHTCGCKPAAQAPRAPLHNPCFALLGAALGRTLTFARVMRASLRAHTHSLCVHGFAHALVSAHVCSSCARWCHASCCCTPFARPSPCAHTFIARRWGCLCTDTWHGAVVPQVHTRVQAAAC